MTTLAEGVSGGEARHLATQVPEELRGYLHKDVDFTERIDLAEFLNEVGDPVQVGLRHAWEWLSRPR
ncbi:DUF2267 domain-containing protein [Micromonospora orduensis]|uniref:DUF2267 domain-containing protein n=1 Tax=Micromonospora orduensis TaxID=1420891 RepID=A0A5C4QIN0_9ACTN|nr:DUF2267 domain-containing protein [Micromonospora orduensis]